MSHCKKVIILSVPYCEAFPSVAPALLAACLENAGITAKAVDFNIDFYHQFNLNPYWAEYKNFLSMGHLFQPNFNITFYKSVFRYTKNYIQKLVDMHSPDCIGLSIFTSESLDFGLILSYIVRKYFPGIKLIAGGKGLEVKTDNTYNYEKWINTGVVDAVVQGDAETAIIDVIKNNLTGIVIANKQTKEDLDNIPLAKWDDYNFSLYDANGSFAPDDDDRYLSVTASKGCVRQCTFCDVASFWPDYLYRDPIKVANEIIFNYKSTGIKKFKFNDNLINGSISNYREMNRVLASTIPNTISYSGYAIFRGKNQMPEDDFHLAQVAGCKTWSIGVESGSEKVRYDMKKKFTNSDIDWSVNMLLKYNIQQNWLLMVGYPTETEADFIETKNLLLRYKSVAASKKIVIQITPTFMLLNNSPLLTNETLAMDYGLSHLKDKNTTNDKFWTSTKYLDNDYPTRSRRWKELVLYASSLNYSFGVGMPVDKWHTEIANLDRIYDEQKVKIFPIHQSK
jgi:radical SAM superfamily enzyme YgiQ (UPF0313 family)